MLWKFGKNLWIFTPVFALRIRSVRFPHIISPLGCNVENCALDVKIVLITEDFKFYKNRLATSKVIGILVSTGIRNSNQNLELKNIKTIFFSTWRSYW